MDGRQGDTWCLDARARRLSCATSEFLEIPLRDQRLIAAILLRSRRGAVDYVVLHRIVVVSAAFLSRSEQGYFGLDRWRC